MQTRRQFLETIGAAALGATTLAYTRAAGLDPAKPAARLPLGIQLYTVRSLLARDFDGTLARLADIGYREVEFAGYFDHTPAQVRETLKRHRLTSPSAHMQLPASDDAWARTLDDAKTIGHRWVVIPFLDASLRRTLDDWQKLADRLNTLGARTRAAGLRLAYHNHDFEFARNGDATFYDLLVSRTDPKNVDFEMDVYWVTKAGGDPLDLMKRYHGRFPLLHLKDATAAPERRIVDVGSGTIDFKAVLAAARPTVKHAFVEHDQPSDPLVSARASRDYLSKLRY